MTQGRETVRSRHCSHLQRVHVGFHSQHTVYVACMHVSGHFALPWSCPQEFPTTACIASGGRCRVTAVVPWHRYVFAGLTRTIWHQTTISNPNIYELSFWEICKRILFSYILKLSWCFSLAEFLITCLGIWFQNQTFLLLLVVLLINQCNFFIIVIFFSL